MSEAAGSVERQQMDVDIACVGFGPAMGGFLTTLSRELSKPENQEVLQSKTMPGMPLQVNCYERSDDIGFGVSGVVTKGRGIRETFPDLDTSQIPMATAVKKEKVAYLFDSVGASRRSKALSFLDGVGSLFKWLPFFKDHAMELPYIPPFMAKHHGLIFSIGQFNQWAGSNLMASGMVQIWPGMPVSEPLFENEKIVGIRLADQGVTKTGKPDVGYMPGMDLKAALTVIGDGPVGPAGEAIDQKIGMPKGNHKRDWAVGMKAVVQLPEDTKLEEGTVYHTFGFPEPEIFGFLYVHPDRLASCGIFVPSWFKSPVKASYRYLQHWMMHPYLWRHLEGSTLKSWGAKSLQESGQRGEPFLVGDGYARIGEGSGSTDMLTGSGVDEAWATGAQLAEGVTSLLKEKKAFTKENLETAYAKKRQKSWVGKNARIAKKARDGFQYGFIRGLLGMGLSGVTGGAINLASNPKRSYEHIESFEDYYKGKISSEELNEIRNQSAHSGASMHEAIMDRVGWPKIPYDGKLLVSHQDALLMGGKVQASGSFADHIVFLSSSACESCTTKSCIEVCSGQAITPSENGGVPQFDKEKCVHCGACIWSCSKPRENDPERSNIDLKGAAGGLHSAEN